MIIINRALSQKKKKKERQKGPKIEKKIKKGDNVTILFHTCASKQHHDLHDRESPMWSLSYTSGNFHYRTCLVYSNDGLPQKPQVFMSKQVGCTPTSFLLLSIHSSSASVAWQSLLLALTSIDGHIHSSLISLVDVRLSPFLSSPHNPPHYIIFHPQRYIHGLRSCIA